MTTSSYESLSHSKWDCKYHLVFIPKCRKKELYGKIPPKYSVAEVVGYIKGKSAISVARQFSGRQRNFNGESLWTRGYAVSTVGFEESQIRLYIKNQEQLDSKGHGESGSF
jgi:putative transposase